MKKIFFLIFSFFISTSTEAKTISDLTAIKLAGVIIFGTEGTYAPYTFHNNNHELTGFDIDIGRAIADKMNIKVKFIENRWDGLIAGLDSKRYDAVISQIGITPERQRKYDFSNSYIKAKIVLIVHNDNTTIKNFSDLKKHKTAQSLTSNYSQLANKYGAYIIPTDNFIQSLQLVIAKRADATINDNLSFLDFKKHKPHAKLKIVSFESNNEIPSCIIIRKKQIDLLTEINKALEKIKIDGTYKTIYTRYFGN